MSLNGINARIPLQLTIGKITRGVQGNQAKLAKLQTQIASGQRFQLPGESPSAAIQSLSIQKLVERGKTLQANLQTSLGFLAASDNSLGAAGDAIVQAQGLLLSGIGATSTPAEKVGLADQVKSLITSTLNSSNSQYQGRYLFGGSESDAAPFELTNLGAVRYSGDDLSIETYANASQLEANNVNGQTAFSAFAYAPSKNLNPALELTTRLSDLNGGEGVSLGIIDITVDNGTPILKSIDLSTAETIGDVKTRIENAFATSSVTVAVTIDPTSKSGLKIDPSAGTIEIPDADGLDTATQLGIASGPVASLVGKDLDPRLTELTTVASLNGGTGIGTTSGFGVKVVIGNTTTTVDLNGATTVGELLSKFRAASSDLYVKISDDGQGISIASRQSGIDFQVGENGGTNATALGIRSLSATTTVASLNRGQGLFGSTLPLEVTRRDGTTASISLAGVSTVQDVLDKINAVDPGVLTASFVSTGNGITLVDSSGTGTLTVGANATANALGIAGSNSGGATGVLVGSDVNPLESPGSLNLLVRLEKALRDGNNQELSRLGPLVEAELHRITVVRGDLGSQQQLFDQLSESHKDLEVNFKEDLSQLFDTDLTEAITQVSQQQTLIQASLQIGARTLQLSILEYL